MTTTGGTHGIDSPGPASGSVGAGGLEIWLPALALLVFVAGRCLVPMDETDLFYNLRLGELVLDTHDVPRTNLLSFTYPDHPDPNLAWLFQIVLALVCRAGGIPAAVLLKTAFVLVTFAVLFRVALRRGAHPALAALALALAAWAAEPRFVERPHLVTFLGLALLLLALERAEAGRPRWLFALIPVGLVWANGNSCFFLAPGVLVLYAVGAWADGGGWRPPLWARRALVVAGALLPLMFATPAGTGVVGYVANHFRMPWVRPLQEYRTAEWPTDAPFLFLLAAVSLVTVLPSVRDRAAGRGGDVGACARQWLPVLALAVLGARRIRFVAEFALLAGPYVAARATDIARRVGPRSERAGERASTAAAVGLLLLAIVPRVAAARVAAARVAAARDPDGHAAPLLDLEIEQGLVPYDAIRWLEARGLRDRLYNDLEVGSYLTRDWPRHRVFQDPRINAYPEELHRILRRRDLGRLDWEALLGRFQIEAALISYPELNPRAALFDPARWALLFRSGEALVFVRRDVVRARSLDGEEIPLTFALDVTHGDGGVEAIPLVERPEASLVARCEWHRRVGDIFLASQDAAHAHQHYRLALGEGIDCLPPVHRDSAREQAGLLALRFGEAERAAALLAGLPSPVARASRGLALTELGRAAEGLADLDRALVDAPGDPEAHFGRALALLRLDRPADAAAALREFLRRWPTHRAAPRARQLLDRL